MSLAAITPALPDHFAAWFAGRGWQPHAHQLAMVEAAAAGASALLIAPTGGGKTLAGFLPSLIDLTAAPSTGVHTLYISPLKALAVDIARNLEAPVAEMALPIRVETRTGDTPASKKKRQRSDPPQILLTTPESLALLISYDDAARFFAGLRCVVIDELHALVDNSAANFCPGAGPLEPPGAGRGRSACRRRSPIRSCCGRIWRRARRPPRRSAWSRAPTRCSRG